MNSFLIVFFWLLMGISAAYFANQRGRSPYVWFAIGILFGLLGLLFVFLLPVVNKDELELEQGDSGVNKESFTLLPAYKNHEFFIKDWFYLDSQHKQQGPVSFDILKKMLQDETIQRSSFVWCEGMLDWKKIEEFGELKDVLAEEQV